MDILTYIEVNNINIKIEPWFYDLWLPVYHQTEIIFTEPILKFVRLSKESLIELVSRNKITTTRFLYRDIEYVKVHPLEFYGILLLVDPEKQLLKYFTMVERLVGHYRFYIERFNIEKEFNYKFQELCKEKEKKMNKLEKQILSTSYF